MRTPHFMRLVRIDDQHFITACRHGLIHLTWERTTTRLARDEFRRLAGLLERAADDLPPTSMRDGQLRVTVRLDDDCELQLGSLILLLTPTEFQALVKAAREAIDRLDEILASGMWDRPEEEEPAPDLLEQLRRIPFSLN